MKVVVLERSDAAKEECGYRNAMHVIIDEEKAFAVQDGEPEDSNLRRDFRDVYLIPKMMEKAYNAGKNGESFEVIYSKSEEI